MGMDIYLMKPILIEPARWEKSDGEEMRGGYAFQKFFEKFIFVKHKVHTVASMAEYCNLSVEKFIEENNSTIAEMEANDNFVTIKS